MKESVELPLIDPCSECLHLEFALGLASYLLHHVRGDYTDSNNATMHYYHLFQGYLVACSKLYFMDPASCFMDAFPDYPFNSQELCTGKQHLLRTCKP